MSDRAAYKEPIAEILGHLNYSSGAPEPRFLANINRLFDLIGTGQLEDRPASGGDGQAWRVSRGVLRESLERLRGSSEAFRQVEQAEAVLRLVFEDVLPAYRDHHCDLLFHQSDEALFQPFFIGRVFEAVLAEGAPWDQADRITRGALKRLNDFTGHRPVAVLETKEKLEPYAHERVRPIPLYVRGAGVAGGRYHDLIAKALEILGSTDPNLLREAQFDPDLLDELAIDPRAYDFDHPANRRPNYHFGQWDPHCIDNRGYYRRFVLQQVTLEAMLQRIGRVGELPPAELLLEAAAVLAGTILMGSGVSGDGPDAHDSEVTLATLLQGIALYRDDFYKQLLARLRGSHGKRLRSESVRLHQPFGGARQDLNQELARRRAEQLQHVHLAHLFARMGYREAAMRQAQTVAVASARMTCEIQCGLSTAHLHVDRGEAEPAAKLLAQIEDLLHRAIECGALIDPWNILGFGAQFSLFPALENTIHDIRADELIDLMGEIFALYARVEKEAAAAGQTDLKEALSANLGKLAQWWDKFATLEVSAVAGISGHQAWESAADVATALGTWHRAGTAAGDIAFWREHVETFHSPKAYALVVEALLDRGDLVASMALLMQWISQVDEIPLADGEYSFHELAIRWMRELWQERPAGQSTTNSNVDPASVDPAWRWSLTRQFLDRLEANAEQLWEVPRLGLFGQTTGLGPRADAGKPDAEEIEPDEPESLFSAAYEEVTYRDSANDGFEGEMLEGQGGSTDFELSVEAERIVGRLGFLGALATLWKLAATASLTSARPDPNQNPDANQDKGQNRDETLAGWLARAVDNRHKLIELLSAVHRYRIAGPGMGSESLIEFDQRQAVKDGLLEQIIGTCLETGDAARMIAATTSTDEPLVGWDEWEEPAHRVLRAICTGKPDVVREGWDELLKCLARQPLLYVPTSRGGNPLRIVASRNLQQVLHRLLTYLPRLGLIDETFRLIGTIQAMEQDHPVGSGAVTEFDEMFKIGWQAIIGCLVASAERADGPPRGSNADAPLTDCLERASEPMLGRWLAHSRNIRLSVLDPLTGEDDWRELVRFIQKYGDGLFTQKFMQYGTLRAILHQGVDDYLTWLVEDPTADEQLRLLADLDGPLARDEAVHHLSTIIEAVVDDYVEYMDYNSTTTQSDRGDMLYTLLDFLRLLASYDRVAWNLLPVVLAHEVLVRRGRIGAAEIWQEAFAERTAGIAEEHLERFEQLSRQYGMRLPSVAERLGERFVRPLVVDRLRALVGPAIDELRTGSQAGSFELLEAGIARLTEQPTGVGFDVPNWLEALEQEVNTIRAEASEPVELGSDVPQVVLPLDQLRQQVERWSDSE